MLLEETELYKIHQTHGPFIINNINIPCGSHGGYYYPTEPEVDWRIKFLKIVPEAFMYHKSIDEALNDMMFEVSKCKGCGDTECQDCNDAFAEWCEKNEDFVNSFHIGQEVYQSMKTWTMEEIDKILSEEYEIE